MFSDLKHKLITFADNIKSELLFDLKFNNLSHVDFFRAKFEQDRKNEITLCKNIYKYNKHG